MSHGHEVAQSLGLQIRHDHRVIRAAGARQDEHQPVPRAHGVAHREDRGAESEVQVVVWKPVLVRHAALGVGADFLRGEQIFSRRRAHGVDKSLEPFACDGRHAGVDQGRGVAQRAVEELVHCGDDWRHAHHVAEVAGRQGEFLSAFDEDPETSSGVVGEVSSSGYGAP